MESSGENSAEEQQPLLQNDPMEELASDSGVVVNIEKLTQGVTLPKGSVLTGTFLNTFERYLDQDKYKTGKTREAAEAICDVLITGYKNKLNKLKEELKEKEQNESLDDKGKRSIYDIKTDIATFERHIEVTRLVKFYAVFTLTGVESIWNDTEPSSIKRQLLLQKHETDVLKISANYNIAAAIFLAALCVIIIVAATVAFMFATNVLCPCIITGGLVSVMSATAVATVSTIASLLLVGSVASGLGSAFFAKKAYDKKVLAGKLGDEVTAGASSEGIKLGGEKEETEEQKELLGL